jgi:hypothetical protein
MRNQSAYGKQDCCAAVRNRNIGILLAKGRIRLCADLCGARTSQPARFKSKWEIESKTKTLGIDPSEAGQ